MNQSPKSTALFTEAPAELDTAFGYERAYFDGPNATGVVRDMLGRLPETNADFKLATLRNHAARGIYRPLAGGEKLSTFDAFALGLMHYLGAQYGMTAVNARGIPLTLIKYLRSGRMGPEEIGDPDVKPWCSFFVRYNGDTPKIYASQPYDASEVDVAGLCEKAGVSSVVTINWKRVFDAAVMASVARWEFLNAEKE